MAPTKAETNGTNDSKEKPPTENGGGPVVPEWLTKERFVDLLEENIEGFKKIVKFEAGLTGGGGENYASIMLRVKVKVELEGGSTKDVSFMIKTAPQGEQAAMMVNMMGLFPKEIAMYGKYLPEFEQMYRDVGKQVTFGPKFYTLKKDPGVPYVLLEDISPHGFKNVNRLEGLDKEHTESVLKILAELHAVSAVRYETKGEYESSFTVGIFNESNREAIEAMTKSIHDIFLECLSKYKTGVQFLEKVTSFQDKMIDLFIEESTADPDEFNVLNHDGSSKDVFYMIKTVPQGEQGAMMVKMMGLFPKETAMYGKLIPEFEKMYQDVGKKVKFGPKYYTFPKSPEVDYVLLEDLTPKGFKNVNRLEGLDKDHTESVLRILAELHAVSAVRFETKGEYDKPFVESMLNDDNREALASMFSSVQGIFLETLSKHKSINKFIEKVKKLQDNIVDLFIKEGKADPDEFNVLNHGDLWANNIMFRHNDEGKREETILVDYQISRYGSPTIDLYYFLLSSTNLDLKLSNFDYFVKYYYDHLVENLELLNYPKKIPMLKELQMQLLKHSIWGFSTVRGVMAAALLDPSEKANIDNFVQEGAEGKEFRMQMFDNPRYIRHLEAILPWLDTRGLLDC